MLDEKDLAQITRIIQENNTVLIEQIDLRTAAAIEANNPKIITAVAEMLEDNVFPQFAEIHSELQLNSLTTKPAVWLVL